MIATARVLTLLALLLAAAPAQDPAGQAPARAPQGGAAQGTTQGQGVQNPFTPFDRAAFEAHVRKAGANDQQMAAFAQQVGELGITRAADNLMRALHPTFHAAVERSEAGDPVAALALTQVLAATTDPVLQGHVRYHLARVFLDGDDPDRAVEVLNDYLKQNINKTPLDAEAAFFYSQALAEIPLPELAVPRFRAFLQWFPDASERFRAVAQQRIQELLNQQDSRLHLLADGMKKTKRDLRKQKTDEPVQVDQLSYIEQLNELIKMYEEMEKQSGGSPSGNGPSSGPANSSALVEGEARIGALDKKTAVADRWGNMKDKDREKIEADVQNTLPPQYRKMLEEYYKKLGTGDGKQ